MPAVTVGIAEHVPQPLRPAAAEAGLRLSQAAPSGRPGHHSAPGAEAQRGPANWARLADPGAGGSMGRQVKSGGAPVGRAPALGAEQAAGWVSTLGSCEAEKPER